MNNARDQAQKIAKPACSLTSDLCRFTYRYAVKLHCGLESSDYLDVMSLHVHCIQWESLDLLDLLDHWQRPVFDRGPVYRGGIEAKVVSMDSIAQALFFFRSKAKK